MDALYSLMSNLLPIRYTPTVLPTDKWEREQQLLMLILLSCNMKKINLAGTGEKLWETIPIYLYFHVK